MNEEIAMICFDLISKVGYARSCFIEAISQAKNGKFNEAKELIEKGNETFHDGHKTHASLIQKEANGDEVSVSVLMLHAEDLLMSAETFKIICEEFIDVYKRIN